MTHAEQSQSARARRWLVEQALPFWAAAGIDPANGGAVEALDHDGRPLARLPRRIRIHPRQAYVFAGAGRDLGRADYLDLAERLLAFGLAQRSPEGWLPAATAPDGRTTDHRNALYDLAFFVLAGAELTRAGRPQPALWPWLGAVLDEMRDPAGRGWFESRHGAAETPRTQNSHMHLFEASTLAAEVTGDPAWAAVREECLALFREVFLQPDGTVLEFFGRDWAPLTQGQRVEPGHGAEWIYLLDRYHAATGRESGVDLDGLFHGVVAARDGAGLLPDVAGEAGGGGGAATRRLWPQTELLKACRAQQGRGRTLPPGLDPETVIAAIFRDYLDTPVPGGWFDQRDAAGGLLSSTMPSSSFYHLYVAFRDPAGPPA